MSELHERGNPIEDEERMDEGTIEERTEELRDVLSEVYDNVRNGEVLDEILTKAEANYEKDMREWDELLTQLEEEVKNAADDDDAAQILDRYKNRARAAEKTN
jgi:hypothetical protein